MNNYNGVFELTNKLRIFLHCKLSVSLSNLEDDFLKVVMIKNSVCFTAGGTVIFHCEFIKDENTLGNILLELKSLDQDYVLIIVSNNGCYVISLSEKKVHFWHDAFNVVVDDYLHVGHDQIVVLLKDNHHYITDFDCCEYDTRISNTENKKDNSFMKSKPEYSIHPAVVNSLNSRLSQCLDQGQILKSNIQEKENLIKQSWNAFMNMSADKRSSKLASLVPLFGNKKINSNSQDVPIETEPWINFIMLKQWTRKIGESFVFGFALKHTSEIGLFNCSIALKLNNTTMYALSFLSNTKFTKGTAHWVQGIEELFFTSVNLPLHENLMFYDLDVNIQFSTGQQNFNNILIDNIKFDRLKVLSLSCVANKEFCMRDADDKLCYEFLAFKKGFVFESEITSLHSIISQLCVKFNCKQITANGVTVLMLQHIQGEIHFHTGKVSTSGIIFALSMEKVHLLASELAFILPADVSFKLQAPLHQLNEVRNVLLGETEYRIRSNDVIVLDSPPEHSNQTLQNKIFETDSAMSQILNL